MTIYKKTFVVVKDVFFEQFLQGAVLGLASALSLKGQETRLS